MAEPQREARPPPFPALERRRFDTLQVNLGYRCNQACTHCHVDAGPKRTEAMDGATVDLVLQVLERHRVGTLDLTGGAPELNPHFRPLAAAARGLGARVIDRCNLTVLGEPGQEGTAAFLAAQRIDIVASLPCYLEGNVDAQRGKGVYAASIRTLAQLNALGYGDPGSGLTLDLVFNPQGPVLPPAQAALEEDYRRELRDRFGLRFNRLLVLCNMPINRFRHVLESRGGLDAYLALLHGAHRPENLGQVMCRSLISVDWRGYLYDCDFNQMLDLPPPGAGQRAHLSDLLQASPVGRPIAVADHCWGCTAGQGSSCGGALAAA
ncbi:MAG: arsenosugar biosynthesis radical SAM (seleno)protein ArsS [Gammaproteobacteria bacterium]